MYYPDQNALTSFHKYQYVCYNICMHRPKALQAAPVDTDSVDLLAKIRKAVAASGYLLADGTPLEDYDPLVQLATFAAQVSDSDDPQTKRLRIECAKEVAKYLHPQKRSQEVIGAGGGPIQVEIIKYD